MGIVIRREGGKTRIYFIENGQFLRVERVEENEVVFKNGERKRLKNYHLLSIIRKRLNEG